MAVIKLGPTGSETTLPQGIQTEVPVDIRKNIIRVEMSDGTMRYAHYKTQRHWTLRWKPLSLSDVQTLQSLYALNQVLHFQNNYEDATWYNVTIMNFSFTPMLTGGAEKYWAEMEIEEAVLS
jgi:hypothetical protein